MTHPGGGTPAPSARAGEQPVERLELDRARRRRRAGAAPPTEPSPSAEANSTR